MSLSRMKKFRFCASVLRRLLQIDRIISSNFKLEIICSKRSFVILRFTNKVFKVAYLTKTPVQSYCTPI